MPYDTDSSWIKSAAPDPSGVTASQTLLKVLLIEDSHLLQEMLGAMLDDMEDVTYFGAVEGESEALEKLANNAIDLVIIDIELKQGSGTGVLAALRSHPKLYGTPHKVVLSNYAHASMQRRCERLGADAFFDKTLSINDLLVYIRDKAQRLHT